jgi:hypothetical protein
MAVVPHAAEISQKIIVPPELLHDCHRSPWQSGIVFRGPVMNEAAYLRRQSEICRRLAYQCIDLGVARRLRVMAAEFQARAAEVERESALARALRLFRSRMVWKKRPDCV